MKVQDSWMVAQADTARRNESYDAPRQSVVDRSHIDQPPPGPDKGSAAGAFSQISSA